MLNNRRGGLATGTRAASLRSSFVWKPRRASASVATFFSGGRTSVVGAGSFPFGLSS